MISPMIFRLLAVLPAILALLSCGGSKSKPLVDVTPLGDAVRFLAIAIILGCIITSIFRIWGND